MQSITISRRADKLIVSQNGNSQTEANQLDKFVIANASVAIWLIFFAIGGGIFALYYAHIGYVPEMEWKASLVYLFIGSLVGGVLGLLLTMSLYLPGLIWSESIVFDPCLHFSYSPPTDRHPEIEHGTELCLRTIFSYLGLPFLLVLVLSHVALLAGQIAYWVIAVVLLGLTFLVMKRRLEYRMTHHPGGVATGESTTDPEVERHAFKLASEFTLAVLLNQVSMYVIYWLSGSPSKPGTFVVLTLICTSGVWIACHVVAFRHRHYPRQAIVASLVAAGLLLFTADNFSILSMRLMNHFGIGYSKTVDLLVTEKGQDIVKRLDVPTCADRKLCKVEILSKMGDQYYLRVDGTAYVTLPKADVIAIKPLN